MSEARERAPRNAAIRTRSWLCRPTLFEFKVVELEPQGAALQQLLARACASKYCAEGKPIHLVGIEFRRQTRNVTGFEVETIHAQARRTTGLG